VKDKHILRRLTCLLMCVIILSSCVNTGNKDDNELNLSTDSVSNVAVENVTIKNVDANLKIGIKAPSNYSKEAVLKGIKFENVSSPIFTSGNKNLVDPDILVATGSKGSFKVYEEGGFKKGDIYQITLTDNKLSFDGYGSNIREYNFTVKGEEVLNAKVKIHDELGANLLAIKRYILNGGTAEERIAIENILHRNLQYLKNETSAKEKDEYAVILDTAAKLDMKIKVVGDLTEAEPQRYVIVTGIHECLTNTIRHARGDELTVILEEDGEFLTAVFTNNGKAPKDEIKERGGLALLRALTEESGGTMQILSKPAFELIIKLPKEGTTHVM